MKRISILGSTGSIGTQTLEICREYKNDYKVVALSCNRSSELMLKQIIEFEPEYAVCYDEISYKKLKKEINTLSIKVKLLTGLEGLKEISALVDTDIVVSALVGNIGLEPTIEAIKCGKRVALANKEVLVTSGELIMALAKEYKSEIIPVDSEHSAIFQCLQGNKYSEIDKVILTASGGPFRQKTKKEIESSNVSMALKHPNWTMGQKITIDSATLMNKGLEVIEAKWLFDVSPDQIDVVVHPESIIHSMVEYKDSSVIAQLGLPDMKLPILYSFTYPDRVNSDYKRLDLTELSKLTFEKPKLDIFPCLELAFDALRKGGTYTTVLNAANEELVNLFINEKIGFYDISNNIEKMIGKHSNIMKPNLADILAVDKETREKIRSIYRSY
ncbi:MAG: 1-deoxy-D-xylulose-5-phosphate reductoisomerase [Acidaminobacteraceae bacterium]